MSITIKNQGNNASTPVEMKGKGPFVFTFTPPEVIAPNTMNRNAMNKAHEKSCLLRELILLISSDLDSISYMTNFESQNQKQSFGEYQDDDSLETTIREVISGMANKNIITSNPRIRVRLEQMKVHGIDFTETQEGGLKKRSTRTKKAPKSRTTKKH